MELKPQKGFFDSSFPVAATINQTSFENVSLTDIWIQIQKVLFLFDGLYLYCNVDVNVNVACFDLKKLSCFW